MRRSLLNVLRCPASGEMLDARAFEECAGVAGAEADVIAGVLISQTSRRAYPIVEGVPVMLPHGFTADFLARHKAQMASLDLQPGRNFSLGRSGSFSFSQEWEEHWQRRAARTWGWTLEQRVAQFYLETETTREACQGQWVLDAGSGSGQLSHALAEQGMLVVAVDMSVGVFYAERHRSSANVHYVQGDLLQPPLAPRSFAVIVSNGVLHHTPSTRTAFNAVARLVREGGRYYVWLYHWPTSAYEGYLVMPLVEVARRVISRLPARLQAGIVNAYARALYSRNVLFRRRNSTPLPELVVEVYDLLTPRWRHYHTPQQVSRWFFENEFSAARLTHWDNPLGFGMLAIQGGMPHTPGVNFSRNGPELTGSAGT